MTAADHITNRDAFGDLDGENRVTRSASSPPEREFENSLRPHDLDEFVGQARVVENLRIAIQAAQARDETPDHILLSGPPGLGKTSLARIVAEELGSRLSATTGPALDRPKDLVGILTQLQRGDVLFVDEIHRIPVSVEEYLYTAMEDFSIDFTIDQGPNARIVPLSLERFTLVGATTREGLLSAPFRSRFGLVEKLSPYPTDELERIISRAARLLGVTIDGPASLELARRSRGTPRIAGRFLRRTRDVAQVQGTQHITEELAREAMTRLGVDAQGLDDTDRRVLTALLLGEGEPVGLKTIAAAVGETEDTIEDVYEPHLLRCGFLRKTARGRLLTEAGADRIKAEPPLGQ